MRPQAGQKVQAIRELRQSNPWLSLKEAKDYVEGVIERGVDNTAAQQLERHHVSINQRSRAGRKPGIRGTVN
jgi:ribosomal protein L7/L12